MRDYIAHAGEYFPNLCNVSQVKKGLSIDCLMCSLLKQDLFGHGMTLLMRQTYCRLHIAISQWPGTWDQRSVTLNKAWDTQTPV